VGVVNAVKRQRVQAEQLLPDHPHVRARVGQVPKRVAVNSVDTSSCVQRVCKQSGSHFPPRRKAPLDQTAHVHGHRSGAQVTGSAQQTAR